MVIHKDDIEQRKLDREAKLEQRKLDREAELEQRKYDRESDLLKLKEMFNYMSLERVVHFLHCRRDCRSPCPSCFCPYFTYGSTVGHIR